MADAPAPPAEAGERTRLRVLLEDPEARPLVSRAVASLLAMTVVSIGLIGVLLIWHLARRGRLIQANLPPPRDVRLPEHLPRTRSQDAPKASPDETTT